MTLKDPRADAIWYVTDQQIRFNHDLGPRGSNEVLKSRRLGVVFRKEDREQDMIPIAEWNAQKKEQKKRDRELARQKRQEEAAWQVSVTIPPDELEQIDACAQELGMSRSAYIVAACRAFATRDDVSKDG